VSEQHYEPVDIAACWLAWRPVIETFFYSVLEDLFVGPSLICFAG
jgi:hypothetical protein